MNIIFWAVNIIIVTWLCILKWKQNRKQLYEFAKNMPGHDGWPLVGIFPSFFGKSNQEILNTMLGMIDDNQQLTKLWFGPYLVISINSPQFIKTVLNSEHCLQKAFVYDFLGVSQGLIASKRKSIQLLNCKKYSM